jgi:hypothetical protein
MLTETLVAICVKCPLLLPYFNQNWSSEKILVQSVHIKCYSDLQVSLVFYVQTDRQTVIKGAFLWHFFVKVPVDQLPRD